jgi:hypothetical protein
MTWLNWSPDGWMGEQMDAFLPEPERKQKRKRKRTAEHGCHAGPGTAEDRIQERRMGGLPMRRMGSSVPNVAQAEKGERQTDRRPDTAGWRGEEFLLTAAAAERETGGRRNVADVK